MDYQLRTMNILTDDWLIVDYETGKVTIEYEKSDGRRTVGTNMIRRLIADQEHTVTIQQKYGNDEDSQNHIKYTNPELAEVLGVGSDSVITLNNLQLPTLLVRNQDGSTSEEVATDYITLGHELIHALRAMGGISEIRRWEICVY